MRTIELNVYKFEELSKEAQAQAIENKRNQYYESNDFTEWAIDDCGLLEPQHQELETLFGENYEFPLIKNNREIYFSTDRDRYIDISKAIEITNHKQFLLWLGIKEEDFLDEELFIVYYKIGRDTIEFDTTNSNIQFTEVQESILEKAKNKFENHIEDILTRIEKAIDYRFTDEAIKEDIECDDIEFLENGKIFDM